MSTNVKLSVSRNGFSNAACARPGRHPAAAASSGATSLAPSSGLLAPVGLLPAQRADGARWYGQAATLRRQPSSPAVRATYAASPARRSPPERAVVCAYCSAWSSSAVRALSQAAIRSCSASTSSRSCWVRVGRNGGEPGPVDLVLLDDLARVRLRRPGGGQDPRTGGGQLVGGLCAGMSGGGEALQQLLAGQPPAGQGVVERAAREPACGFGRGDQGA